MNSLAEALGMSLPARRAIPAPYRERGQNAYAHRQAHRRHGPRGPEAVRHHDARGLPQRDRGQLPRSAVQPMRRSISNAIARHHRRRRCRCATGRSSGTRCRCWSTCSPPASTSARTTTGRAASRRGRASSMRQGLIREQALTVNGRQHRRELPQCRGRGLPRSSPFAEPLRSRCRLHRALGQPFRLRDHEDLA